MRPLAALHVYEEAETHSAAMNMALDEVLLEFATAPSLRFYGWRAPAISFGYFDRYAEVADDERELVRRWTGGGVVPHGDDLTYSLVLPAKAGATLPRSKVVYAEVHEAIRQALPVMADLATHDAPKVSAACFANPVTADVLLAGEKIAGAAQRRARAGLLHQGSIQYRNLPANFREAFAAALCLGFERRSFTARMHARAEEIARQKYGTREWLTRR